MLISLQMRAPPVENWILDAIFTFILSDYVIEHVAFEIGISCLVRHAPFLYHLHKIEVKSDNC